jgi:hypothetical protein
LFNEFETIVTPAKTNNRLFLSFQNENPEIKKIPLGTIAEFGDESDHSTVKRVGSETSQTVFSEMTSHSDPKLVPAKPADTLAAGAMVNPVPPEIK